MTTIAPTAGLGLDPAVRDLAAGQGGAVTTRQLLGAGMTVGSIIDAVRDGTLEHPGRGLYLDAAAVLSDEDRYRATATGALLLYPDAVLAGETALIASGVTVWGSPMKRPALLRPVRRTGGMSAVWVRPLRGSRIDTPWGPATPVGEALAQHALDHGIEAGLVSADHALHTGAVTPEDLEAAVAAVAGWRHGSRAVAVRRHADGLRESVGESRTALALALAGIDVEAQVEIADDRGGLVARADFRVRDTKVLVEFDGKVKYASGDPQVLWDEKKREDRLRRLGYVVVRITWADLERPGAVAAKVRAALAGR